jgi:hypothetical protein
MKVAVSVTMLKGVRVAVAFPPPAWVVPGMGDALLARLQPWFPALPVLLVSTQPHGVRAHAAFQAQRLVEGADLSGLERTEIDLAKAPPAPSEAPPF